MPDWLLAKWPRAAITSSIRVPDDSPSPKAWSLLNEPRIFTGSGNPEMVRIAGWLRIYHPEPVTRALLDVINDARCEPPLKAQELDRIVRGVYRYGQPGVNGHPAAVTNPWRRTEG